MTEQPASPPWSKAELVELSRRLDDGEHDSEIAPAMGRTLNSVTSARKRYLKRPINKRKRRSDWPEEVDDAIRRMAASGASIVATCAELKRSEKAVRNRAKALSVQFGQVRYDVWTDAQIAKLRAMVADRQADDVIAEALDRTITAVATKRRDLGLPVGAKMARQKPASNLRDPVLCPLTLRRGDPEAAEAIRLMLTGAGVEAAMLHVMQARGLRHA